MCKKHLYVTALFIHLHVVPTYIFKRKPINVTEHCYKLWLYSQEWISNESSMLKHKSK